jgi:hypothetical protein
MIKGLERYKEFRRLVSQIIPRQTYLGGVDAIRTSVQEKGRKTNYHQFDLQTGNFRKHEKLLNTEEVSSFLEISIRAAACPMPFNLDVYDGLLCPFGCKYCHPAGTKILMADGTEKNIERVRDGDAVMTYNERTDQHEEGVVHDPQHRMAPYLIEIEVGGKTLQLTPEHPILTKRGWVDAGQLTVDDEVLVW